MGVSLNNRSRAKRWAIIGTIWGLVSFILLLSPFREIARESLGRLMKPVVFILFPGVWGIFTGETFLHLTNYTVKPLALALGSITSMLIGAFEAYVLYLIGVKARRFIQQ